MLQFDFYV